jgi:hypothetical protein
MATPPWTGQTTSASDGLGIDRYRTPSLRGRAAELARGIRAGAPSVLGMALWLAMAVGFALFASSVIHVAVALMAFGAAVLAASAEERRR